MGNSMDTYSSTNVVPFVSHLQEAPMNIRLMAPHDLQQLEEIHAKYYSSEFTLDDFLRGFITAYTVEDESGRIVTSGGIRPIAEVVLMTNKDCSIRDRREALYNMLHACMFAAGGSNINSLHAFVQDETWMKHLKRVGFKETNGQVLCLLI